MPPYFLCLQLAQGKLIQYNARFINAPEKGHTLYSSTGKKRI